MTQQITPPVTDELPVSIRAYATAKTEIASEAKRSRKRGSPKTTPASEWSLIFDTETTTDASQSLRFGTYQVRKSVALVETGIFFDPDGVSNGELETLQSYASRHDLTLRTRDDFVDSVFFGVAYKFRATIVGFNLPFDISRIAIRPGSARGWMRGGFTFGISKQRFYPNIQIKHLSQSAAVIRFAAPMGQKDDRSQRKRGNRKGIRRGHFVDVKTLSRALLARSFSLASLCKFLRVDNPKLDFEDFDRPLDHQMVDYAVRDTQATWECYAALIERLETLNLPELRPEKIYSEASIGKGYLHAMGITPWRQAQSDFPPQLLATIIGTYCGGRSEVRIRREMRQVMLCDFLSMYPTVCTLMGLWCFVIADGMTWRDATAETRGLLASIDVDALGSRNTWRNLATLVRVQPDADIFPVRASYSGDAQATIGLNYLTADRPIWFTLADCIASKLLTGKAPKIIEAISFKPGDPQPDLRSVAINGNADYCVDPADIDFFKRIIELRHTVKVKRDTEDCADRDALDTKQNALKIAANATSYGIYVEVNVAKLSGREPHTVYSAASEPFTVEADKTEIPGTYFHPLLATLITGAARLMLAITERLIGDKRLDWAFCDTDSMAIAKPGAMPPDQFLSRVDEIVEWFASLNPYEFEGSILKVEDENYALGTDRAEPLYCWAVSSKRYALFNLDSRGEPIMRKVSAHGLGHLLPPYADANAPADLKAPDASVLGPGIERWHVDLWTQMVRTGLSEYPDRTALAYHPALNAPAISRYSATTPDLLRWFKNHNEGRAYRDQVKPFGFLLALSAQNLDLGAETIIEGKAASSRRKRRPVRPIAPFDSDYANAAARAFCRETGKPVDAGKLRTYRVALARYHIRPESKFLNANYTDRGVTQRRHVRLASVRHIGKEANDLERQFFLGANRAVNPDYGLAPRDLGRIRTQLEALVGKHRRTAVARALGIKPVRLKRMAMGERLDGITVLDLAGKLPMVASKYGGVEKKRLQELRELRVAVQKHGLRKAARRFGFDPSNLRRKLYKAKLQDN